METQILFGALVELDLKATGAWYDAASEWGCDCGDCQNFLEIARRGMLPREVQAVLEALGIPAQKATYVCLLDDGDGLLYQFSYRVAGRILRPSASDGWGSCGHDPYPYGAPGFPEPHFDVEFCGHLP